MGGERQCAHHLLRFALYRFCGRELRYTQARRVHIHIIGPGTAGPEPTAMPRSNRSRPQSRRRRVYKGSPISPGLATGVAIHYRDVLSRSIEAIPIPEHKIGREVTRFRRALRKARTDAARMQEHAQGVDSEQAGIFEAQTLTLRDKGLIHEIERAIRTRRVNAEAVVRDVFARKATELRQSTSPVTQQRADDLHDMARHVLNNLLGAGMPRMRELNQPLIAVAKRMLPSDIVHLNKLGHVGAIVAQEGSVGAHAAILAREYSMPFVAHIAAPYGRVPEGARLAVDGRNGRVVVNATDTEVATFERERKQSIEAYRHALARVRRYRPSYRGQHVAILANTFVPADIKQAQRVGCDGIGLYRMESIYLSLRQPPTEDQLLHMLRHSLGPIKSKPVVVRLLDTGGDKSIPSLPQTRWTSSPLALRGIHFLLQYEPLLRSELRACLRLAAMHDIRILLPMVTTIDDVKRTRRILEDEKQSLRKAGIEFEEQVPLGVMIETPAALLTHAALIEHSDFVSLGTNDLVQYVMASDRELHDTEPYYQQGVRLVLDHLRPVVQRSRQARKECTLCGELAADTRYTKRLLALGLRSFSMIPHEVPRIKEHMRSIERGGGSRRRK